MKSIFIGGGGDGGCVGSSAADDDGSGHDDVYKGVDIKESNKSLPEICEEASDP